MAVYVDEWGIPRTIPDFGADPSGSTAPNPALGTNPVAPSVRLDEGAGRRGGGLAAMLAPSGSWSSRSVNSHPFQGLQGLLESSILSRLMSGAGQEGGATRGLEGGGLAWNHLEDPFGRLTKQTETWNPAAVMPPRRRLLATPFDPYADRANAGSGFQTSPTTRRRVPNGVGFEM